MAKRADSMSAENNTNEDGYQEIDVTSLFQIDSDKPKYQYPQMGPISVGSFVMCNGLPGWVTRR